MQGLQKKKAGPYRYGPAGKIKEQYKKLYGMSVECTFEMVRTMRLERTRAKLTTPSK